VGGFRVAKNRPESRLRSDCQKVGETQPDHDERRFTLTIRSIFLASLIAPVFAGKVAGAQKDGVAKRPDPLVMATEDIKEILLIMNPDKNGKITREQWVKFMVTEFDRLDSDRSGTLDPKKIQLEGERIKDTRLIDLGK
jgi:hypothetical protein